MKIARTIGPGLGLIVLAAIGAATWSRAQPPVEKIAPRVTSGTEVRERIIALKTEVRERIIALRTEVDMLQLEHDGARATLIEWLRDMRKADLLGIDLGALIGSVKLELGGISGDAASLKQMSDLMGKLDVNNPEAGLRAVQENAKKGKDDLRRAFDRAKQEFATLARRLNEKKFDLAEAETQYHKSEAR